MLEAQTPEKLAEEVRRRRTFAIISHPDAGKTTLTEKLLLYGGAVNLAGSVKARKNQAHATSDWMELEKQRGISITSTVLSFDYQGYRLNLLDTPGHQDFSEDTYRTLVAVDCAVMILDAAKGLEAQTLKLFDVCKRRGIPLFTFVNKMDRPSQPPLDLLDEVERTLGLRTIPMNWPLGNGPSFRGVFDRRTREVHLFERVAHGSRAASVQVMDPNSPEVERLMGDQSAYKAFREELELLEMAGEEFDAEAFATGRLTPVYFGSAVSNFGVQLFLDQFLDLAPQPAARRTDSEPVHPQSKEFSGFVFKIQADMNPRHRDRVAFMRICSGQFERGMKVQCVRTGATIRLSYPQQLFAQERQTVEEAYAGDVVGLVNSGELYLGDTLLGGGQKFRFEPIPLFPPEHFARVTLADPSRRKAFQRALDQLSHEGAVQIFYLTDGHSRDVVMGAVGRLQFEVVQYRIKNDYSVDCRFEVLPFQLCRWLEGPADWLAKFSPTRTTRLAVDPDNRPVALFPGQWDLDYTAEKNPDLVFHSVNPKGLQAPVTEEED